MITITITNQRAIQALTKEAKKELQDIINQDITLISTLQYLDKPCINFQMILNNFDSANEIITKEYEIELDIFKLMVLEYLEGL